MVHDFLGYLRVLRLLFLPLMYCFSIWCSNKPPSREELETVENKFEGIPLKFCHVDNGRVSFLSFNKAALPSLP